LTKQLSIAIFCFIVLNYKVSFAFNLVIDPGHGGEDHGATQGGIKESEITLNVALKLAAYFLNDSSIKVILTRPSDESLSLRNRVEINDFYKGDLFVSLHVNSSIDKRAKGADFYIGIPQTKPSSANSGQSLVENIVQNVRQTARLYQSQYLASDTYNSWKDSAVTLPRSVRQGPFYVINRNSVPSILVEFGFITNPKEAIELTKEENQDAIAKSIYNAVKTFQSRKLN